MSFRRVAAIFDELDTYPFGGTKLLILLCLGDWSNDQGEVAYHRTAIADMMRRTRTHDRTVRRNLAELEAEGYLAVQRSPGLPSSYRLTTPGEMPGVANRPPGHNARGTPGAGARGLTYTEDDVLTVPKNESDAPQSKRRGEVEPITKAAQRGPLTAQEQRRLDRQGGKRTVKPVEGESRPAVPAREARGGKPMGVDDIVATITPEDWE